MQKLRLVCEVMVALTRGVTRSGEMETLIKMLSQADGEEGLSSTHTLGLELQSGWPPRNEEPVTWLPETEFC